MMNRSNQNRMVIPAVLNEHFKMVEIDFHFSIFKNGFTRKMLTTDMHEHNYWDIDQSNCEVDLNLFKVIYGAADDLTDFGTGQVVARFNDTQKAKLATIETLIPSSLILVYRAG